MKVLFTDNDYVDVALEREIFARAGIDLHVAQCRTAADVIREGQGCSALLVQYAPIDAAVFEAWSRPGDLPSLVFPDCAGLFAELRVATVSDLESTSLAIGESIVAGPREAMVQLSQELQRLRSENVFASRDRASQHLNAWSGLC